MKLTEEQEKRFWANVAKPPRGADGCWMWKGYKATERAGGHGLFSANNKSLIPHRIIYEKTFGKIKRNMVIYRVCKNALCVNAFHMEEISRAESTFRSKNIFGANSRKTHCNRGHPFSGGNLMRIKDGRRCRTCFEADRKRYLLKLARWRRAADPLPYPTKKELKEWIANGNNWTDISIAFGVNPKTVAYWAEKYGIYKRTRK